MSTTSLIDRNALNLHRLNQQDSEGVMKYLTPEQTIEISIRILKLEPSKRTHQDLLILYHCTKQLKFFKDLHEKDQEETHFQCCRVMTVKTLAKKQVLYKQGQIGNRFYLILDGRVELIKIMDRKAKRWLEEQDNDVIEEEEGNNEEQIQQQQNEKTKQIVSLQHIDQEQSMKSCVKEQKQIQSEILHFLKKENCEEITTLGPGEGIGELALIYDRPREQTVISIEDSAFVEIEKKHYQRILEKFKRIQLLSEIQPLLDVNILKTFNMAQLKTIFLECKELRCVNGQIIFREQEKSEFMCFIMNGNFKVFIITKQLQLSSYKVPSIDSIDSAKKKLIIFDFYSSFISKNTIKKSLDVQLHFYFINSSLFKLKKLSVSDIFGEEDLYLNKLRSYTVVATGEGILKLLQKKLFFSLFQSNFSMQEILQSNCQNKLNYYNQQCQKFVELVEGGNENNWEDLKQEKKLIMQTHRNFQSGRSFFSHPPKELFYKDQLRQIGLQQYMKINNQVKAECKGKSNQYFSKNKYKEFQNEQIKKQEEMQNKKDKLLILTQGQYVFSNIDVRKKDELQLLMQSLKSNRKSNLTQQYKKGTIKPSAFHHHFTIPKKTKSQSIPNCKFQQTGNYSQNISQMNQSQASHSKFSQQNQSIKSNNSNFPIINNTLKSKQVSSEKSFQKLLHSYSVKNMSNLAQTDCDSASYYVEQKDQFRNDLAKYFLEKKKHLMSSSQKQINQSSIKSQLLLQRQNQLLPKNFASSQSGSGFKYLNEIRKKVNNYSVLTSKLDDIIQKSLGLTSKVNQWSYATTRNKNSSLNKISILQ